MFPHDVPKTYRVLNVIFLHVLFISIHTTTYQKPNIVHFRNVMMISHSQMPPTKTSTSTPSLLKSKRRQLSGTGKPPHASSRNSTNNTPRPKDQCRQRPTLLSSRHASRTDCREHVHLNPHVRFWNRWLRLVTPSRSQWEMRV
jgi:hypothetical protein